MSRASWWAGAVAITLVCIWSYWGTFLELMASWMREADYSHGFLVGPIAVFLLWIRRDQRPGSAPLPAWPGLVLMAASIGVRLWGARLVTDSADGYSLILWTCGAVWAWAGWPWLRWSLPVILFLVFMVPLPYRVETWLSVPLQHVAAVVSATMLQMFGQPAFAYGTTILLGEQVLSVERECSGLRIFVGIFALAFAYLIAARRELWENTLLIASIVPVALLANSTRIVVSGLLFQFVSSAAAKRFSHDFAGWLMILLAGLFFALVLCYLGRLVRDQQPVAMTDVVSREQADVTTN
jgi:exosortase